MPNRLHRHRFGAGAQALRWSSYRDYSLNERGPVLVNEPKKIDLLLRNVS
jgi:hypothetical protein